MSINLLKTNGPKMKNEMRRVSNPTPESNSPTKDKGGDRITDRKVAVLMAFTA